jgi:low temperature requirement protein LtrA
MATEETGERAQRVTPLELFFDLVFVFTITQLTQVLSEALTWTSLWHIAVMFGLVFWMYDGYAWLTNAVTSHGPRVEKLLLAAMAAYLILAISIPHAFTGTGLTFGLAYLFINVIHSYLYLTQAGEGAVATMRTVAPTNVGAAGIVLVAGAVGGLTQEIVWTLVAVALWVGTRTGAPFDITPAHFVERHGLLVIIAIGESVVASGVAAHNASHLSPGLVLVVLLGLLVSAVLWWVYFAGGDEEIEAALGELAPERQMKAGIWGFGYGHFVMLLGVIIAAVGIRRAVLDPGGALALGPAFALSGGVALFLIGDGFFRETLDLIAFGRRELGGLAVLVAVPVTTLLNTDAGLALTAVLAGVVVGRERGLYGASRS